MEVKLPGAFASGNMLASPWRPWIPCQVDECSWLCPVAWPERRKCISYMFARCLVVKLHECWPRGLAGQMTYLAHCYVVQAHGSCPSEAQWGSVTSCQSSCVLRVWNKPHVAGPAAAALKNTCCTADGHQLLPNYTTAARCQEAFRHVPEMTSEMKSALNRTFSGYSGSTPLISNLTSCALFRDSCTWFLLVSAVSLDAAHLCSPACSWG